MTEKPINTSFFLRAKFLLESFYKEYKLLIIFFVPAVGAFYQLIELLKIGFPYLRFFSTTQLINDGVAITIILIILLILQIFLQFIFEELALKVRKWFLELDENSVFKLFFKSKLFFYLELLITILLALVIIYPLVISFSNVNPLFEYDLLIVFILVWAFNYILNMEKTTLNNYKKRIEKVSIITHIGLGILLVSFFTRVSNFFKDDRLENIKIVESNFQHKFDVKINYEDIKYFNDKYVFIVKQDTFADKSKVFVLPFEDLINVTSK